MTCDYGSHQDSKHSLNYTIRTESEREPNTE